jgi:hypothetical protein
MAPSVAYHSSIPPCICRKDVSATSGNNSKLGQSGLIKVMFLKRLFGSGQPVATFSHNLAGEDRQRLIAEMKACIERRGGELKNARRANALVDLFSKLTDDGKRVYAGIVDGFDEIAKEDIGEKYSKIEEAELFGGSASKLAVLDSFESPQRRLIQVLGYAGGGQSMLQELGKMVSEETLNEIYKLI